MNKTKIVNFKDLSRWDVGYFLGNHVIKTNFKLELFISKKRKNYPK